MRKGFSFYWPRGISCKRNIAEIVVRSRSNKGRCVSLEKRWVCNEWHCLRCVIVNVKLRSLFPLIKWGWQSFDRSFRLLILPRKYQEAANFKRLCKFGNYHMSYLHVLETIISKITFGENINFQKYNRTKIDYSQETLNSVKIASHPGFLTGMPSSSNGWEREVII